MTSHSSRSPRPRRTPALLLALGILSAAALALASLTDFGDPRIAARAAARQSAEARAREVQLTWEDACRVDGPLAGTTETFPWPLNASLRLGDAPPPDPREVQPVLSVLLAAGQGALDRGEAAVALDAIEEALRQSDASARDHGRALFEALRAASATGQLDKVETYRARLLQAEREPLLEGTSGRLLGLLVDPVDAEAAWELLLRGHSMLPAPEDRVRVTDEAVTFELDPWWSALRAKLERHAPEKDWDLAFQVPLRKAMALASVVASGGGGDPREWTTRWTLTGSGAVLVAHRQRDGVGELALVNAAALIASLGTAPDTGQLRTRIAEAADLALHQARHAGLDPRPLTGSPLLVAVEHLDPEAAARPQLRRIRWIRAGLLGLAALVLLASISSARAAARARRLARLRSTFVASVSHDLRTPTHAILLLAEALEQDVVSTAEARGRYHTQIRREAQRLRRLVEDLLDGARIDRGASARVERRLVRSAEFFTELSEAMEERATAARGRLRVTVGSLPEAIYVDPDGVYRALWNLFENALSHGAHPDRGACVEVRIEGDDEVLRCTVEDDGPGISARHVETIFAPFERLVDRRAESALGRDSGTGLGLAIVRAIAEGHGGTARVEPVPSGARFVVTFRSGDTDGNTDEDAA